MVGIACPTASVESHYGHIKEKLELRNSRELTRMAVTLGQNLPTS